MLHERLDSEDVMRELVGQFLYILLFTILVCPVYRCNCLKMFLRSVLLLHKEPDVAIIHQISFLYQVFQLREVWWKCEDMVYEHR